MPTTAASSRPRAIAGTGAAQNSRLIARRPLIDHRGRIAGWDLKLSALAQSRLRRPGAPRVLHEAYWLALSQAANAVADNGQVPLIDAPEGATQNEAFLLQLPAGSVLRLDRSLIAPSEIQAATLVQKLHTHRIAIAAPIGPLPSAAVDFELLDATDQNAAQTLRDFDSRHSERHTIAINVASFEEMTNAVRAGIDYCCGALVRVTNVQRSRKVPVQALSAAHILAAVGSGRDARSIAEMFKGDVALSFRLLRLVNSPAFGLNRPAESLQDAVVALGSRELVRWLCVLLLSADAGNTLAPALHQAALTRARMLELLAIERGRIDPPDALFVLGAFSLLDLLLGVPIEVALALVPMSPLATEALIAEGGPWCPYIDLARALESDDGRRLESACVALAVEPESACNLWLEASVWAASTAASLAAE